MRNFSKKLAFVLAAAMVFTAFAPAAKAKAAEDMAINRKSQTLYVNEGLNHKGAPTLPEGLYGNVSEYDFYVANKPANWETAYTFEWSSSDPDVMTVGKAGLATAVAPGKADVVCVVTEKATSKVTTLKATVTVKANAETITITNAEDFEGQTVKANDKITLTYKMEAEDGGKATDLVKWVADPATGVTVKDGVFTFGEDALPGDYLLYCETYQSDKYNQVTATSEKVTVTFATNNTFEVKQDTVKMLTVKFDAPVKAVGDVTINRLYKGFEVPAIVKKVDLAKDGMSATVELYSALKNNEEYAINVEGYETYKLTASAGTPVEVLIYNNVANKYADAELVYLDGINNLVDVNYRLIDAKGVDVTDTEKTKGTLLLTAETDEAGNYFVTDEKVWFASKEIEVTVFAEFQMYDKDGNLLTPAKGMKTFISQDKPPVEVVGIADWKVSGEWYNKQQSVPLEKPASIALKVKLSDREQPVEVHAGSNVLAGDDYLRFEALNPDVAALDDFNIIFFKQGTAKILVYYCYKEADGTPAETPVYQLNVTAKAATKLQSFTVDKPSINIGTVSANEFDKGTITLSIKDNHGGDYNGATVTVEGIDDATKAAVFNDGAVVDGNKVHFYGAILKAANNNKDAAQMTFKIKVRNDDYSVNLEKNVTVVYKSRGEVGTEYIRVEANGFGVDVARTAKDANTKKAKTGTFSVYQYSNGIKVDTVDVMPYKADEITTGNYYFKVTKDGKDITEKLYDAVAGNTVTLEFSGIKTEDQNSVTYDLGAGNYGFALYEVVNVSGKAYTRPVNGATAAGAVTCNTGSYAYNGRVTDTETLANDLDPTIFAMFKFKNAQGGDTLSANYTVQANRNAADYVYVTSITFYDDLGDGSTAKYVVPIGTALKLAK